MRTATAFAASLCAVAVAFGGLAQAQSFPSKNITIVVPFTPGSTTDGLARVIATEMSKDSGQAVIVDNKAGASGIIASQFVANAAPDGYTIFITTNTTHAGNPYLFKKLPYDPVKDFAPITAVVKGYQMMVVNPNVPVKNVAEFIALAKKEPGKLTFGEGSGSARIAAELFMQMTGTKLMHVPYKANPQAITDLIGGQVDMMIVDLTTSLPQAQAGKLKGLAVTSKTRSKLAPELPTIDEAGVKGYEFSFWNAAYAPAKTPEPVVKRLNEMLHKAIASESVHAFIVKFGMEPYTTTPAGLASFQASEAEKWGRIIKGAGIEPE